MADGRDTMDATDGARQCMADNPPTDPFDVGDVAIASLAPGSTGPEPQAPSVFTIASDCVASGGTGCDAARFISREAASCLAELSGFEAGIQPWSIALVYHHSHGRVVWNVMNVVNDDGAEGYSGGTLTLDAMDGRILSRSGYTATP
jgi:hypothetical protein